MRDMFGVQVGLSDHTPGIGVSLAAIALGATVIEKHFTLNRTAGGVDAAFSLVPEELAALVTESEKVWQSLGTIKYGVTELEKKSLGFRRSLYVVQDMRKVAVFTSENIRAIRPGFGLPPRYYEVVIGKKANRDLRKGTPLSWDLIYG